MIYCFFSAQYLPTVGGVERYTHELAHCLAKRGHQVLIVTSSLPGLPEYEHESDCVEIFRISSLGLLHGRMPVAVSLARFSQQLENRHIDRIIVQTRLYPLCLLGMRFARKRHIPFLTIEHGSGYIGFQNLFLDWLDRCYENSCLFFAKRWCNCFFAVSQASASWLASQGITAKGILYNSVDHEAITQVLAQPLEPIPTLPTNDHIVLFVGRLIPEKGILQLVKAVENVSQTQPVCLLVAGDGPLYTQLHQMQLPALRLLGTLPREDLLRLMARCDVLCLPSDSEGFPTCVVEAAVCKCYVITAPFGGAKELIAGPEYGTVMQGNTQAEIEQALSWAFAHPDACRAAAQRTYERFLLSFTWEQTCTKLEAAFSP